MTVPSEFRGVWQRAGLLLDGQRVVDTRDVLWLQTDSFFGDIRAALPGANPGADPRLEEFLEHWVIWGRDVQVDQGELTWFAEEPDGTVAGTYAYRWDGCVLVESGTSSVDGRSYAWEEEWVRLTDRDVPTEISVDDEDVRLLMGRFDLRIHRSSGRATGELLECREGRWSVRATVT